MDIGSLEVGESTTRTFATNHTFSGIVNGYAHLLWNSPDVGEALPEDNEHALGTTAECGGGTVKSGVSSSQHKHHSTPKAGQLSSPTPTYPWQCNTQVNFKLFRLDEEEPS